jgi:hypothetical protein
MFLERSYPALGTQGIVPFDASAVADRLAVTSAENVGAVISALAATLREAGVGHLMTGVAEKLSARGLHSLAAVVRASAE